MARQYPSCPWFNEAKTRRAKLRESSQCIPDPFIYTSSLNNCNKAVGGRKRGQTGREDGTQLRFQKYYWISEPFQDFKLYQLSGIHEPRDLG